MAIVIILWVVCGIAAGMIGQSKNRSFGGCFVLGLLLGIIGVIIAACLRPEPAHMPMAIAPPTCQPGWYPDPWGQGQLRYNDGYRWSESFWSPPPAISQSEGIQLP